MCKERKEYVKIKGRRYYVIHSRRKPYRSPAIKHRHHHIKGMRHRVIVRDHNLIKPMSLREFSHLPEHYDRL